MSNKNPKFELNLNEVNSLGFTLTIEGSTTNVDATKPEFRFVLSENGKERSWLYPMNRDEEGDVVVQLPPEDFFSETKQYKGQVEVILGSHYFVPTSVDIQFIRPLRVEAVAKVKTNTSPLHEDTDKTLKISSVVAKTKNKPNKEADSSVVNESKVSSKKKKWEDLSEAEQKKLVAYLKDKKLSEIKIQKAQTAKKESMIENKFKDHLKDLMSSSLGSEDSDE